MSVADKYFIDQSIFNVPRPSPATQLANASSDSAKEHYDSTEATSSEPSTSSEETSSCDPSESCGNSASESDSSSAGSDSSASDETTLSDSEGDVITEGNAPPIIIPTASAGGLSSAIQSPVSTAELIPSETKASPVSPSDSRGSSIASTPSHRTSTSQSKPLRPLVLTAIDSPDDLDSPKGPKRNALLNDRSDNRGFTMTSNLPSELAGGWGDDPEPAPWDWKGMPFDYMGILEEQRRTVYYELHERDGREEWVVKNYKKDGKYGHGKDGRSRGEHRGNTLRRPHNRSEDQSDAKTSPDVPRGRGRVRGPSSTNHKSLDHAHSKQEQSLTQEHSHAVEVQVPSIIDTPIDLYDAAGLISADPDRVSLPILESKDEVKKSCAAWTKEGKREREMSYLILPRAEKVTMPAAILPKPDKIGKRKTWESTTSARPSEPGRAEGRTVVPRVEGSTAPLRADQAAPVASSLDAGQLLLQLVTLLRQDDAALASLKSIVDGMASSSHHPAGPTQEPKVEAARLSPPVQERPIVLRYSESAPIRSDEKVETPEITGPAEAKIPLSAVEAKIPPAPRDAKPVPSAPAPRVVVQHQTDEMDKEIPPPEGEEIMVFPKTKTKSHKSKDRYDKDEIHKSKSKDSSKESSIVVPVTGEHVIAAAPASDHDDLVREELWYFCDDGTEDADEIAESPVKRILKAKISAVVGNERPHIVGKLYEPPRFHASLKHATDATPPGFAKVADKSNRDRKVVEAVKPTTPPKSPSPPFDFNPPPPRRIKRRVILMTNDASTQTISPPKVPPSGPPAEIVLHPSLEKSTPVVAKPAVIHPAVTISPPKNLVKALVKPATVQSPPEAQLAETTTRESVAPVTLPGSYTGSDDVYMKTLKNVDAGDDLMIVSNPREEPVEPFKERNVSSHPHSDVVPMKPDVAPVENVPLKQDLLAAMSRAHAIETLASITGDPRALYNLLTAITSSCASAEEKKPKKEREKKEKKHRRDKDEKKPDRKHRKSKMGEEGEELFVDLLGDEESVASLPVLHPIP